MRLQTAKMVIPSHYVIRDILHTVRSRNSEEIRKTCEKYASRYRDDTELAEVCSVVSTDAGKIREKEFGEMESMLEELLSARRHIINPAE